MLKLLEKTSDIVERVVAAKPVGTESDCHQETEVPQNRAPKASWVLQDEHSPAASTAWGSWMQPADGHSQQMDAVDAASCSVLSISPFDLLFEPFIPAVRTTRAESSPTTVPEGQQTGNVKNPAVIH